MRYYRINIKYTAKRSVTNDTANYGNYDHNKNIFIKAEDAKSACFKAIKYKSDNLVSVNSVLSCDKLLNSEIETILAIDEANKTLPGYVSNIME